MSVRVPIDRLRRVPPIVADGAMGAAIFALGTYEFITAYDPYPASQWPAAIGLLAVAVTGVAPMPETPMH